MKKIVVQLVQDTPMWHFQGAFDDCCLRATEVKPKLDRFLLAKLDKGELSVNGCALTSRDDVPSTWWANEDKTAFNYKMRISAQNYQSLPEWKEDDGGKSRQLYPIYFGKMGPQPPRDMKLILFDGIKVELIVFNYDLSEILFDILPVFFASSSFGTRQDKGFGCFRVSSIEMGDRRESDDRCVIVPEGASYYFTVGRCEYPQLFNYINYFHKVIRSGVNEPGCYVKSMMYHYAKSKGGVWDKPVIRTNFQIFSQIYEYVCGQITYDEMTDEERGLIRRHVSNRSLNHMIEEYESSGNLIESKNLYRDALGLATLQEWKSYHKDKIKIAKQNGENLDYKVRFKSPIDYHPCYDNNSGGYIVYIILHELSSEELRNARFTITDTVWKDSDGIENLTGMHIADAFFRDDVFSVADYFDFICHNRWRVKRNWPAERDEERDCIDIQPGKENREPYTLITQVFRTLNKVAK